MRLFIAIVLLLAALGAAAAQDIPRVQGRVASVSEIRAVVLDADRLAFPNARIRLQVVQSSNPLVLDVRRRAAIVTADNYFWRTRGSIALADRRNIGSLAAYYLLQGDEIRARIFSGFGLGARWFVYDINRLPARRIPVVVPRVQERIQLDLEIPGRVFEYGAPVRMTMVITNLGNTPRTLRFPSGRQYDFIVSEDGRTVWRWSQDRVFIQALTSFTLRPGESRRFAETWRQVDNQGRQVEPGCYSIAGVLPTMDETLPTAGPITVCIRPRSGR